MTIQVPTAHLAVLTAKISLKSSRLSTVQARTRRATRDRVNKGSKRTWTKKEHRPMGKGTDSSASDKAHRLRKKSWHYQNHQSKECDSWRSSRIDRTRRTSKQHTRRVRSKLWRMAKSWLKTLMKILAHQMKFLSLFFSLQAVIKNRSRRRRRRRRMLLTSTTYWTSTQMSSITANSFAEKFSAQLFFWPTLAAKSKWSTCPFRDSKSLTVIPYSASTIEKNCLLSTKMAHSSKTQR